MVNLHKIASKIANLQSLDLDANQPLTPDLITQVISFLKPYETYRINNHDINVYTLIDVSDAIWGESGWKKQMSYEYEMDQVKLVADALGASLYFRPKSEFDTWEAASLAQKAGKSSVIVDNLS